MVILVLRVILLSFTLLKKFFKAIGMDPKWGNIPTLTKEKSSTPEPKKVSEETKQNERQK